MKDTGSQPHGFFWQTFLFWNVPKIYIPHHWHRTLPRIDEKLLPPRLWLIPSYGEDGVRKLWVSFHDCSNNHWHGNGIVRSNMSCVKKVKLSKKYWTIKSFIVVTIAKKVTFCFLKYPIEDCLAIVFFLCLFQCFAANQNKGGQIINSLH